MGLIVLGGGLVFFTLAVGVAFSFLSYVPLGAKVGGMRLGGVPAAEAQKRLAERATVFFDEDLEVVVDGKALRLRPAELGLEADSKVSLASLSDASWRGLITNVVAPVDAPLLVRLDVMRFREGSRRRLASVELEPRDAELRVNKNNPRELETLPAAAGRRVRRGALLAALVSRAETLSREPIQLSTEVVEPDVRASDFEPARAFWEGLVASGPVTLTFGEERWEVASTTLARWVEFSPGALRINREASRSFFDEVARRVEQGPSPPLLELKAGALRVRKRGTNGRTLRHEESIKLLEATLNAEGQSAPLVVESIPSDVDEERLKALGITSLLGRGESDFAGSPKNRMHNIKVGTVRFHGALIGPGEEFSFNTLLGEVDAAAGYLPELVIKHNKTIPEYGGGLCQLSTTVFRGAAVAGLPIVERQNHSFVVPYYGTPGFDATIYPGQRDFRFKNDTPRSVFLQMFTAGTKLVVELYGSADGRTATLKGPVLYEQHPDGSARALLTRTVTKDGESREEKFYSFYKPKALYPVERNPYE